MKNDLEFQRDLIISNITRLTKSKKTENCEQAFKKFKEFLYYPPFELEIFEVAYKSNKIEKDELKLELDIYIESKCMQNNEVTQPKLSTVPNSNLIQKTNDSILCKNVIVVVQLLTKIAKGNLKII